MIYVPNNIKVGLSNTDRTFAAITFKNSNKSWIQPAYFQNVTGFPCIDKPRDSVLTIKRDMANTIKNYKNEALSGFTIDSIANGCDEDTSVFIRDPRGWKFRINLKRFLTYIRTKITIDSDSQIGGSWVYCCNPDTREIFIVNTAWTSYQKAIKEEALDQKIKDVKKSINKNTLKAGTVYRIYNSRKMTDRSFKRAVYIGEYSHVCDMKKYETMLRHASSSSFWHSKAEEIRQTIMKTLEKPKFVFIYLYDMCDETQINMTDNGLQVNMNRSPDEISVYPWIYMDEVVPSENKEFSISFSPYRSSNSCFYITSTIDPMIVREEDDHQIIGCIHNWKDIVKDQSYRYISRRSQRWLIFDNYRILKKNYDQTTDNVQFNYKVYTLQELQAWFEYCRSHIILPTIKQLKFKSQ